LLPRLKVAAGPSLRASYILLRELPVRAGIDAAGTTALFDHN
jgi:hypothetical protein